MNKQQAIKKAWGDKYPTDGVDEDGWSKKEFKYGDYNVSDFDAKMYLCGANIRPKELKGIEDNNGWIKMNQKRDNLPTEHCKCWLWTDDGIMFGEYNSTTKGFYGYKEIKFSHYLVIQEPKPPLF